MISAYQTKIRIDDMKLLRETIRRIILEGRGMFTHQDLPANACITVKRTYSRDGWWITYNYFKDGTAQFDLDTEGDNKDGITVEDERGWPIYGYIKVGTIATGKRGNCDGALKVSMVEASPGWGPLLYDCAIEFATMKAGGLIPDRVAVSDEAIVRFNQREGSRAVVSIDSKFLSTINRARLI